ncbi:MAG: AarF/ABC1/UbiB kinase family protein [Planctomycetaceae bacterium]
MERHPLQVLRNIGRAGEIVSVLASHGFGDVVERIGLQKYIRWGKRRLLRRPPETQLTTAQRVRLTLETLGPTFIKFGQVLSTRPDLMSDDIIQELSQLQEQVPPFDGDLAVAQVEAELGGNIDKLFAEFDRQPLAAGSLGQVHRARHHDGSELAIKIRRPDALANVERDLALMAETAPAFAMIPQFAVFDPPGLVAQFSRTVRRELNFRREGKTMVEFRRLFARDATLHVPLVYEDLTTDAVLTMEFVSGVRADDIDGLRKMGLEPRQLAANGARIFLKQVFEFGLFHGDPHPGNLRVLKDGSIALLDFGMVGILEATMRDQLVDLLVTVVRNRVDQGVTLVQQLGQATGPVNVVLLRADVADFLDRYYGVPLDQLNIGRMLGDFISLMSSHSLRCPADLMLLLRALISLDGLGRKLDPTFNLAAEVAPFIEQVVRRRYDPKQLLARAVSEAGAFLQVAHDLPLSLNRTIQKLSQDDLRIQLEHQGLNKLIHEFDRSSNRIVVGLVTSALVVSSALVLRSDSASYWLAIPIFLLSGLLGIWLIYGILTSGRL